MINASYMRQEIEEIPEAVARFLDGEPASRSPKPARRCARKTR